MTLHEQMESLADLLAAGALPPLERLQAEDHARSCAPCAQLLREASEFHRWVSGAIAADAPPADLEDRIVSRLWTSKSALHRRLRIVPAPRVLKGVAAVAAVAGFIFLGQAFSSGMGASLKSLAAVESDFRPNEKSVDRLDDAMALGLRAPEGRRESEGTSRTLTAGLFGLNSQKDGNGYFSFPSERLAPALPPPPPASEPAGLAGEREKLAAASSPSFALESRARGVGATTAGITGVFPAPSDDQAGKGKDGPRRFASKSDLQDSLKRVAEQQQSVEALPLPAGEAGPRPASEGTRPLQDTRKLIRTASVDLEVDSYEAASAKLEEGVLAEKGFIATANTQKMPNGKIRAVVTIRVPPGQFESLLARLKTLGTIRHQNVGSQDVTKAYVDLETRLGSKQALLERLRKLIAEAKGTLKEILEVEVQMGKTIEEIESVKGELKYYDNQIALSTLTLTISEKDLGQPFEYVQTLQATLGLTTREPEDAYQKAQKLVTEAGGQVVDSKITRESDGSATGTIRGRVDAEKFPALREAIKALGQVTTDLVNQQKTARGGHEGAPKPDAPLKREQAVVDVTLNSPPLVVTRGARLQVETSAVSEAYPAARKSIEAAGGRITSGSLTGQGRRVEARIIAQIDADKFSALVDQLKLSGQVKNLAVRHDLPAATPQGNVPLLREQSEITLDLVSPPELIGEEHGILKVVRDTFSGSWGGFLWSVEKLFVGVSLAGPWIAVALGVWLVWRRVRRKKAAVTGG